jgi:DNA-directed RNA polymerase subunit RPC12/RpoP
MIAFACPRCQAQLQRHDSEANSTILCPSCNQKLLVPTPLPEDRTMMGQLQLEPEDRTLLGELIPIATSSRQDPRAVKSDSAASALMRCPCARPL